MTASGEQHLSGISAAWKPWLWLNLLCLDAPVVAVAWQALFARASGLRVVFPEAAALFLTAWLIYLADRLTDTFSLDATGEISLRHRFCGRHRSAWIAAIIFLSGIDAWLLARHVDAEVLKFGAYVGAVAVLYFLINYASARLWRAVPLKELTIGSVFAAGTVTAVLPRLSELEGPLWLTLVLFALLCSLNCVCIAFWERPLDEAQARESIATTWPTGVRYVIPSALCIVVSALLASRWSVPLAVVNSCIALSALVLAALHALREPVARDDRTALADLVLLTPLIMLALIH
jgi:hypothetical protein